MPRSNFDQHEKQLTPWLTVRYPMAAKPLLRQRLGELEDMEAEVFLLAEDERVHREALREQLSLGRGNRRTELRRRFRVTT
jgi:hypothetical protein